MALVSRFRATMLATAAVISLSIAEEDLMPSLKRYQYQAIPESRYSWEIESNLPPVYNEILDKYQTIYNFASELVENSQELEPSIVKFVSANFWNLI